MIKAPPPFLHRWQKNIFKKEEFSSQWQPATILTLLTSHGSWGPNAPDFQAVTSLPQGNKKPKTQKMPHTTIHYARYMLQGKKNKLKRKKLNKALGRYYPFRHNGQLEGIKQQNAKLIWGKFIAKLNPSQGGGDLGRGWLPLKQNRTPGCPLGEINPFLCKEPGEGK